MKQNCKGYVHSKMIYVIALTTTKQNQKQNTAWIYEELSQSNGLFTLQK